jgi:hypothetical protein
MGRMAESSAERRLSKEPRMETTASVTCLLLSSDSRSSAARCARVSISPNAGVGAASCAVQSSSGWVDACFRRKGRGAGWIWDWRSSSGSGDLVEQETGWMEEEDPTTRRRGGCTDGEQVGCLAAKRSQAK